MALMTFWRLKQIHKNNSELARLSYRYQELTGDYGLSGKVITDMPACGKAFDSSMSSVDEALDTRLQYQQLAYDNELLIRQAREYIEQFPDWMIRMVLTLYFINGMPMYDVAAAVGVTEQECGKIMDVHFHNIF